MQSTIPTREEVRTAAQGWLKWLKYERRAKPTTVKCWRSAITCWLNLLPEYPDHDEFYAALDARLPSDRKAVRGKTWDALRSFYGWWEPRGGPPFPLRDMPPPKQSRTRRQPLSEEELERILVRLQSADVKARAMIFTLLLAGARPSDVVGMWREDVDLTPGRERIRFRDRKSDGSDEWHSMSPTLADAITLYLDRFPIPAGYLFPGRHGRMTPEAVRMAWYRHIGQGEAGMPSQARRWFAVSLKRSGTDVDTIRQFLGHADLHTTQIYLNSDLAEGRRGVVDLGDYLSRKEASLASPPQEVPDVKPIPLRRPHAGPARPGRHGVR